MPPHVDLRQGFPPVTDQKYNSCTAEALVAAYTYAVMAANGGRDPHTEHSRLFLYYTERVADGMADQDNGAYISTGVKCLMTSGVCEEHFFPYHLGPFTKPPREAFADALDHKVVNARVVEQSIDDMRTLLASGTPLVIGFLVFASIQSPLVETTGDIPLPSPAERAGAPIGGHAVVVVGYDDAARKFLIRNSWGTAWGNGGHGSLPYDYLTDSYLSQDFWVILAVNDAALQPSPGPVPTPLPTPPTPNPSPCPNPPCPVHCPPPPPPPEPSDDTSCCDTCDPSTCCCARTRSRQAKRRHHHHHGVPSSSSSEMLQPRKTMSSRTGLPAMLSAATTHSSPWQPVGIQPASTRIHRSASATPVVGQATTTYSTSRLCTSPLCDVPAGAVIKRHIVKKPTVTTTPACIPLPPPPGVPSGAASSSASFYYS